MDIKLKSMVRPGTLAMIITLCITSCIAICLFLMVNDQAKSYEDMMEQQYEVSTVDSSDIAMMMNSIRSVYYDLMKIQTEEGTDAGVAAFFPEVLEIKNTNPEYYQEMADAVESVVNYWIQERLEWTDSRGVVYWAMDTNTSAVVRNTKQPIENYIQNDALSYDVYIAMSFDSQGEMQIIGSKNISSANVFETYLQDNRDTSISVPINNVENGVYSENDEYETEQQPQKPRNMQLVFAFNKPVSTATLSLYDRVETYYYAGAKSFYVLVMLMVGLAAFFIPYRKSLDLSETKAFSAPAELAFIVACLGMSAHSIVIQLSVVVNQGSLTAMFVDRGFLHWSAAGIAYGLLFILWLIITAMIYWAVTILRGIIVQGPGIYLKKRSILFRTYPKWKEKIYQFYQYMTSIEVGYNTRKTIRRVVVMNFIVLFIILMPVMDYAFPILIIYSIVLYWVVKWKTSRIRMQYHILLQSTNAIANGHLNQEIVEDLGLFNPVKEELATIQTGFRQAVEDEVRSQSMKTELITNVSHDLKTPLTAIITYVDLLKNEDISPKERRDYIEVLERKSLRLKVLIEDLFEISKATSNNVTMNIEDLDIVNLMKQVRMELEDKISASGLKFRWQLPEDKIILPLDGQKTFRVFDNLMNNILKYAMPNTRVYIAIEQIPENRVQVTMKNISAQELNISPEMLTGRFVRGDSARNTEGSGLGLAIAKSFVELENGQLNIDIDGDLFKAEIIWSGVKQNNSHKEYDTDDRIKMTL